MKLHSFYKLLLLIVILFSISCKRKVNEPKILEKGTHSIVMEFEGDKGIESIVVFTGGMEDLYNGKEENVGLTYTENIEFTESAKQTVSCRTTKNGTILVGNCVLTLSDTSLDETIGQKKRLFLKIKGYIDGELVDELEKEFFLTEKDQYQGKNITFSTVKTNS